MLLCMKRKQKIIDPKVTKLGPRKPNTENVHLLQGLRA